MSETRVKRAYLPTSSGGQLHYRFSGDVNAPCLLLLHQAPSDSQMYITLMQALGQEFYCVAPDLPGCGSSDGTPAIGIDGIAEQLVTALTAVGLLPDMIFGHHTGASVAVAIARHLQDGDEHACQALVLSGPPLLSNEQKQALPARIAPAAPANEADLLQLWHSLAGKDPNGNAQLACRELSSALNLGAAYRQLYQVVAEFDFASSLQQLQQPTLLLAGEHDSLRQALVPTAALLANSISLATGNSGTWICDTHASALASTLSQFWQRLSVRDFQLGDGIEKELSQLWI